MKPVSLTDIEKDAVLLAAFVRRNRVQIALLCHDEEDEDAVGRADAIFARVRAMTPAILADFRRRHGARP